jgi:hypothetical protein
MRRHLTVLIGAASVLAVFPAISVPALDSALAASSGPSARAQSAASQTAVGPAKVNATGVLFASEGRAQPASTPHCYPNQCDYAGTDGLSPCFNVAQKTIINWDNIPGFPNARCRNVDESFFNNTLGTIRLHYHPMNIDGGGAWVCIDAGVYIPDLGIYTFNNGAGLDGYGHPVENDVGGSTWASGFNDCTNGIG